ncbi:hypothetical protein LOZ53_000756 [Ophidiomyces ophidiicola]|nr:hypothetical protein LOZ55_000488 [Ophidiomyces ophidiicola]KAI1996694.1 hypothetical protein LOZ54_000065 [Ophidiomyces ophidiicola]KAI1997210.1 hypothetical protein LOZ53_000756 [Ophidiomyces ophidiicola]KAI2003727.1 hypothetical protein LOZ51_000809 [Ophidiomyces ophidiicola]
MLLFGVALLLARISAVLACSSCYGPSDLSQHPRLVRRMQPGALNATTKPKGPLEWGQINFLQTTDTHGWLAGHLKERNYGADWGDFVSYVKHMRQKANDLNVDLLVVDTGDLHDGNGLSDTTTPNGAVSDNIFAEIDYDLLAIGNHELYVTEIAYQSYYNLSKIFNERYLTSNVQLINRDTKKFEDFGSKYRYFTTKNGLRIMAFGVLFDFTGNSNVSKVTKAADMVKESWFKNAVNFSKPIDLFIVLGHNTVRPNSGGSTFSTVHSAIRQMRPDVPIQIFGGHRHIRDFVVYDEMTTGIGSGRYCETLGWLSLTGVKSSTFTGSMRPRGVPNPTRAAVKQGEKPGNKTSPLRYARRYMDWNRLTFAYHARKSQDRHFDTAHGSDVTGHITHQYKKLNLSYVYGCAPKTYCESCVPFGAEGSIYPLLETALAATVVNKPRENTPRILLTNTGSIRFDLFKGPFTLSDSYIVSPFKNTFNYIPDVPYSIAKQVLGVMNGGTRPLKRYAEQYAIPDLSDDNACVNPPLPKYNAMQKKSELEQTPRHPKPMTPKIYPGYITTDDFGTDGDDTPHSKIPYFEAPYNLQGNASFPANGSMPEKVDVVFTDYIASRAVLPALRQLGANYTTADVKPYLPPSFTSNDVLPQYARKAWQANIENCPVMSEDDLL